MENWIAENAMSIGRQLFLTGSGPSLVNPHSQRNASGYWSFYRYELGLVDLFRHCYTVYQTCNKFGCHWGQSCAEGSLPSLRCFTSISLMVVSGSKYGRLQRSPPTWRDLILLGFDLSEVDQDISHALST